jgi:uncharacterized protein YcaQ
VAGKITPQLTIQEVRQLAVESQGLGPRDGSGVQPVGTDELVQLIGRLGYLQRDPLAVVAPSHQLVIWSRLGAHSPSSLNQALWEDRSLFEYYAHGAAIVPTADFDLHRWQMRDYGRRPTQSQQLVAAWMGSNRRLRLEILGRLRREGPLPAAALAGPPAEPRTTSGWGVDRDHQRMLELLWLQGLVAVAGRDARGRLWALTEDWLPASLSRPRLSRSQALLELAARSLDALAVATPVQVGAYLSGGSRQAAAASMRQLARQGRAHPVLVQGRDGPLPGSWFASSGAIRRWEEMQGVPWQGRTTLLSPFDNLIWNRARTELLFGFRYRVEIYVPPLKREYGYYVLPILHHQQLVGRVDCRRDRLGGTLSALAVHVERSGGERESVPRAFLAAFLELAQLLGLQRVSFNNLSEVPASWRRVLSS